MCRGAGALPEARCTGGGAGRGRGLLFGGARAGGGGGKKPRQAPGGPGMHSEECYRHRRKEGRGAAGMASGGGGSGARRRLCRSGGARAGGVGGRSPGKRSRPGGSGMQSKQCYRQWGKEGRWGVRDGLGWWEQRCVVSVAPVSWEVGAAEGGWSKGGGTSGVGRGGGLLFRAAQRWSRDVWCAGGGGVLNRQRSRAGPPVWSWGACGAWGACPVVVWGCALLPSRLLQECGEEVEGELKPESLGRGVGALAAGYPRLGWPGCPGTPWGRTLPTSAGGETTACVSVTEVPRVRSQEFTRRGELWDVTARVGIMKRRRGARMGLAVAPLPRPGGGRSPVLLPPTCESCVWGGKGGIPQWVFVPGAVGTDPHWGRVRSACSPHPPGTIARHAPSGL